MSLQQLRSMEMETIICIRAVCADRSWQNSASRIRFEIFVSKKNGEYLEYTLGELFPGAFTKDDIEKARVY